MHVESRFSFHADFNTSPVLADNVHSCLSPLFITIDYLNIADASVTSPTACRPSSGFLSALKHNSQGVIFVTLCSASTAAVALVLWASAAARTWCTNRWSTKRSRTSFKSSRWPIGDTGTHCARSRSVITCHTTHTAWSRSSGSIRCWTWTSCPKKSWGKSWRDTLGIWGWRYRWYAYG